MTTVEEMESAIRDLGIGWDPATQGLRFESPATAYCNVTGCTSLAVISTDSGAAAAEVAAAVEANLTGDPALLRTLADAATASRA